MTKRRKSKKPRQQSKGGAKLDPNRFQKQDDSGLFSFDPIRRDVLKWGVIAGGTGGLLMLRPEILWQIVGIFVVVLISNYHIGKASRRIPRWHATILSFLGVMVAMFGVIILGTIILTFLQGGAVPG